METQNRKRKKIIRPFRLQPLIPAESDDGVALMRWVFYHENVYPELRWFHHIANGGDRHKAVAAQLKKEGVRAGVWDYFLPSGRGGYFGLYLELKRIDGGGGLTDSQAGFGIFCRRQNYCTAVAHGWEQAVAKLRSYLRMAPTHFDVNGGVHGR